MTVGKLSTKSLKKLLRQRQPENQRVYRKENIRKVVMGCWWGAFMPKTVATGLIRQALLGSSIP